MLYNIYLIIPKDLKNKDLQKSFVYVCSNKYKECKFITEYNNYIKQNKINGKYKLIYNNGGLDNFNIVLLESVNCNKDEIGMYKMYQQTTVNNTIDVIKKIVNHP
jgi:hypothetical protein